jgi:hypothetical protein
MPSTTRPKPCWCILTAASGAIGKDVEFVIDEFTEARNKILRAEAGEVIDYRYVTTDLTLEVDPVPGTMPAGKFVYGEDDFNRVFDVNNP